MLVKQVYESLGSQQVVARALLTNGSDFVDDAKEVKEGPG
jgi:hypothetical protein